MIMGESLEEEEIGTHKNTQEGDTETQGQGATTSKGEACRGLCDASRLGDATEVPALLLTPRHLI